MRLVKYINEGVVDYSKEIKNEEVMKTLRKDCKDILIFMERKKLWFSRYYQGRFSGLRKITPRTDRRPLDTPGYLHDMLDTFFNSKFGWKVRSEGVFTWPQDKYSIETDARGDAFFPIGKLHAVFDKSNEVQDLFLWLKDQWLEIKLDVKYDVGKKAPNWFKLGEPASLQDPMDLEMRDEYFKLIRSKLMQNYTSDLSKLGRANKSEVVWKCSAYYLLDVNQFREMVEAGYFKL